MERVRHAGCLLAGMPPGDWMLHLSVSFLASLAGSAACEAGPLRGARAPFAGLLLAVLLGLAKEAHDLLTNPWSLSPAALRADSAHDMLWNVAGGAAGGVAWVLASVAARSASRVLARSRLSRALAAAGAPLHLERNTT